MTRELNVWWGEHLVGVFTQDEHGDIAFAYVGQWLDDAKASPLSVSLPKRVEPFSRRECRPFFGGLLPEEAQRDIAAMALGVSRANDFALLDRLGGDVAGALQLLPVDEVAAPTVTPSAGFTPKRLDDDALIQILEALPTRPLLAGQEGLRLSLAGAQSKLPVLLVDGGIALPLAGQPSTHILKPPIRDYPTTTENEAFVMSLAGRIGLDAAAVEPHIVGNRKFLLIERYDRTRTDGPTQRVHQEDFCQALGVPPENKYAAEGGPTFRDGFALLRRVSARPAVDIIKLLDAALFNFAVGNADAHGKNFSLLYRPEGLRLAPLYDLLSTVAYPALSPKFAMRYGKRATLAEIDGDTWAAFAEETGLGLSFIRRRIPEICDKIIDRAASTADDLIMPGLDADAIHKLSADIRTRAEILALKAKP